MSELEFNEELHEYRVKGKRLLSVTQLLNKITSEFNADSIIDKMLKGEEIYLGAKTELVGMTKEEIKQLWKLNNTAKSRYGTFIHEGAEKIALALRDNTLPECYKPNRPELKQVLKFFKNEGYTLVEAEKQVFSEEFGLAGTMDLLLEKDGKYYIGDWKTNIGKDLSDFNGSKWTKKMKYPLDNIPDIHFWTYALQFSIYRHIMELESASFISGSGDKIEFGGQFLIHLQESKKNCPYPEMKQITYKKVDTPYMLDEVKVLLEWFKNEK